MGGAAVERSKSDISELIMAAQRAYAEKEAVVLRLGDLKRRADEDSYGYVREMELCDGASPLPAAPPRRPSPRRAEPPDDPAS